MPTAVWYIRVVSHCGWSTRSDVQSIAEGVAGLTIHRQRHHRALLTVEALLNWRVCDRVKESLWGISASLCDTVTLTVPHSTRLFVAREWYQNGSEK